MNESRNNHHNCGGKLERMAAGQSYQAALVQRPEGADEEEEEDANGDKDLLV